MPSLNSVSKFSFIFLLSFSSLFSQKAPELFEKEVKGTKKVKFQNKNTLKATRDKLELDTKLGESLAGENPGDPLLKNSDLKIVHIPSKSKKIGADILIIGKKFKVGHVNTIKRILSSYIQNSFGYEEKDANTLSYYVLYYNVLYRKNINYFKGKYDKEVIKNLNKELLGISKKYTDWPGNTQIVIPLSKNILKDKNSDLTISELKDSVNKDMEKKKKGTEIKQELNSLIKEKVEVEKKILDEKKKESEQKSLEIEKLKTENQEMLQKQDLSEEEKAKLEKEQDVIQKEKASLEKSKKELEAKEKELTKIEKQIEKETETKKNDLKEVEVNQKSPDKPSKKDESSSRNSEKKQEEPQNQNPEVSKTKPPATTEANSQKKDELSEKISKEPANGVNLEKKNPNPPEDPGVRAELTQEVSKLDPKPDIVSEKSIEVVSPIETPKQISEPKADTGKPLETKQDSPPVLSKPEEVSKSLQTPLKNPDPAIIQKQLDEKSKELDEKSKELTDLKKSIQEKDAKSENIIGDRVLFLQVVKYENDGHFTNDLWVLDPDEEEGLYKSPFENICGRDFKVLKTGVLVIGFEGQESDSSVHHLVLLDSETLAVKKISKESVLWRSQLFLREGKIYTFELMNDKKIYLSRFSEELELEARSSEPVNINSDISFNKSKVFVTSKLQGSDATSIVVLNKDDLKISKNFKPSPKKMLKK